MTATINYLPVLEFVQGVGEDMVIAWQMTYKGAIGFFENASYKLSLANASGLSGIQFSSDRDSVNLIEVTSTIAGDESSDVIVNITLKAPWQSFYGMNGKRSGNLQIKRANGAIHDLALVQGTVAKRPTFSGPIPQ